MNNTQIYLMSNMNAFPAERIPMIQKELDALDDQGMHALLMADIKNPTTALIISIFAGQLGIDRFYIGNKELGIAKLALSVVGFLTLFILIGFFLIIGAVIWQVVDWFLIMNACKQANFERLMQQINQMKMLQGATSKTTPAQPVSETAVAEETVATEETLVEVRTEAILVDDSLISEESEVIEETVSTSEEAIVAEGELVEEGSEELSESLTETTKEVESESQQGQGE